MLASSSLYETAPQGEITDQPDFLNAALRVRTQLGPEELLDVCKQVEARARQVRRRPSPRPAARSTWTCSCSATSSTAPSGSRCRTPRSPRRRFVLEPLLELDPELALPDGTRLSDCLERVADQPVRAAGPF